MPHFYWSFNPTIVPWSNDLSIYFWWTDDAVVYIFDSIPALMIIDSVFKSGFASIKQHIWTQLNSSSNATSTDPWYITLSYNTLTNFYNNHYDTQKVLIKGLTSASKSYDGLDINIKYYSYLDMFRKFLGQVIRTGVHLRRSILWDVKHHKTKILKN